MAVFLGWPSRCSTPRARFASISVRPWLCRAAGTQTELDGYIAAECPLCGDIMVQSLNKPLVTEEEETEVAER